VKSSRILMEYPKIKAYMHKMKLDSPDCSCGESV